METKRLRYQTKRKGSSEHVYMLQRKMKNIRIKNKILYSIIESQKAELHGLMQKNYELIHNMVFEKHQKSTLKTENNDLIARNCKIALNYNITKEELIRSNQLINVIDDILRVTTEYLLNAKKSVNDYFTYIPPGNNKQNAEDINDDPGHTSDLRCPSQEKSYISEIEGRTDITTSVITEVEESSSLLLIPTIDEISPLANNYFQEAQLASVINKDSYSIPKQVLEAKENLLLFPVIEEEDSQTHESQPLAKISKDNYSLPEHILETEKNEVLLLEEEMLSVALTFKGHNLTGLNNSDNNNDCNNNGNEVSVTSNLGCEDGDGMLNKLKISIDENSLQECCSLQNNNKDTRNEEKLPKYFEVNVRSSGSKDIKIQNPIKKNLQRLCKNAKQSKGMGNTNTANSENVNGKSQFGKTGSCSLVNQKPSSFSGGFYNKENGVRTRPKRNVPKINYKI